VEGVSAGGLRDNWSIRWHERRNPSNRLFVLKRFHFSRPRGLRQIASIESLLREKRAPLTRPFMLARRKKVPRAMCKWTYLAVLCAIYVPLRQLFRPLVGAHKGAICQRPFAD